MTIDSQIVNNCAALQRANCKLRRQLAIARACGGPAIVWTYTLVLVGIGMIVGWCACNYFLGM